jgi:hypothetical protein
MKRTLLALSFLVFVLLAALVAGANLGVAQSQPVKDARPTPTPDRPVSPQEAAPSAESPETPPLPDLVVEQIVVVPARPSINQEVTIRVTIANRGVEDVTLGNNFWSDLYVDPSIVPIQLGQDGVWEWGCQSWWVPKGGSYTLEATHVFTDVKNYVLYAQVDTDGTVPESNENNNVLGPVEVEVRSPNKVVHQAHADFQMGLASSLDISHPEGVIRPGIFVEPDNDKSGTDYGVYRPDEQVDDPPLTWPPGSDCATQVPPGATCVNQVKPALVSGGAGKLYAAWEDGRDGGVYNRDIYFSYSLDQGVTWVHPDVRINDDAGEVNQASPDLAYDPSCGGPQGRIYAVWQDARNGNYDIYFAYSDDLGATWPPAPDKKLNDDVGSAIQMNPSIAVGPDHRVYVVWQDRRNGNADVYLVRSGGCGSSWPDPNYFVTDDPQMTLQNQVAPSISVENLFGIVVVSWEDWRDPVHPEVYTMWSFDGGQTFGIDVPISPVPPEARTTYRVAPSIKAETTMELVEEWDPVNEVTYTISAPITVIHAAWQEGQGDNADVYYSYATYDWVSPETCPHPYEFCFKAPQEVSGFVKDSAYVRPPDEPSSSEWPIEPSWQGEVTLDLVPDIPDYWTQCLAASGITYSKGVVIAWSDGRSYDDWRYEIRTRRVASPNGGPKSFKVCEGDWAEGVLNDNAKLIPYRDDLDQYHLYQPAATGQHNPSIQADEAGIYVVWDDDRWDEPLKASSVRNRDVFFAQMLTPDWHTFPPAETFPSDDQGVYISPVIDSRAADAKWYVLSWWGATEHYGDLLLQTRFGNTPYAPQENAATGTWTKWTGNPSSTYLGCTAGEGCYYDAPGRHIVRPNGHDWLEYPDESTYRYIQYKVIMRTTNPAFALSRLTALSQVTIYYKGPPVIYMPLIQKEP